MDELELIAKTESLSLRAVVAFAARCARRVLPLYESYGEPDPAIRRAIHAAERFAGGKANTGGVIGVLAAARPAVDNTYKTTVSDARRSALLAAIAATEPVLAAIDGHPGDVGGWAFRAARGIGGDSAGGDSADAAQSDLAGLHALGLGPFGELGRSVDPGESGPLGPLWPNGEPEWYREAAARAEAKAREPKPSKD